MGSVWKMILIYMVSIFLPTNPRRKFFKRIFQNAEQVESIFSRIASLTYVVHLAGDPRVDADWDSVFVNNISGTKNIYEAARLAGVKRIVFASSNHATGAYEGFPPSLHTKKNPTLITTRDPIRPDGFYGVSKAAGEAIARMYYEVYGSRVDLPAHRIGD